jgi:hypothetical protein
MAGASNDRLLFTVATIKHVSKNVTFNVSDYNLPFIAFLKCFLDPKVRNLQNPQIRTIPN